MLKRISIESTIHIAVLLFLLLFLYPFFYGYKENVQSYMVFYQLIISITFFVCLYLSTKIKNVRQLLFVIFLYNIVFSIVLRISFYEYYDKPFGEAVDSYEYDSIGRKYSSLSIRSFWTDYSDIYNLDDFGFSSFVIVVYKIFGSDLGREVLLIINSLCTTFTSFLLYKICKYFNLGVYYARVGSAIWGFFPFIFVTSSVGLKENIFCTLIVCSIFYIQKFKICSTREYLFKALIFIFSTFFFRFVISLMLLIYFIINIISNSQNSKRVLIFIVASSLLAIFLGAFLIEAITGISMDEVVAIAEYRSGMMDSAVSGQSIQLISAFFGPFPNFTRYVQYGIYHSAGLLFKDILSIFCLLGILTTFKNFNYRFYGICFYYIMGILMLVVGGVALDMRYAITFFPAFIILTILGIRNFKMTQLSYIFDFGIFLLILFYNQR